MVSGHDMYAVPCPVCGGALGSGVVVLITAGIAPEDRQPGGWVTGSAVAVHAVCAGVPEEEPENAALYAGDAICAVPVDDEEEGPHDCGKLSRFVVARSDRDTSYGEGGGTAEACGGHLADVAAGMVGGDERIQAVISVRWDKPEVPGRQKGDGNCEHDG
jgi:hypothetical protein